MVLFPQDDVDDACHVAHIDEVVAVDIRIAEYKVIWCLHVAKIRQCYL